VTANGPSSIRRAKCDIAEVKPATQVAVQDMTIRVGAIAVALLAALATAAIWVKSWRAIGSSAGSLMSSG
jgi:hypothetical protein